MCVCVCVCVCVCAHVPLVHLQLKDILEGHADGRIGRERLPWIAPGPSLQTPYL